MIPREVALALCVGACGRASASNTVASCWKSVEEMYSAVLMCCFRTKGCREVSVYYTDVEDSLTGFPQSRIYLPLGSAVVFWRQGEGVRRGDSSDNPRNCWGFCLDLVWSNFTSLRWSGVHLWVSLKLDMQQMLWSRCHLVHAGKEVPQWAQGRRHFHNYCSQINLGNTHDLTVPGKPNLRPGFPRKVGPGGLQSSLPTSAFLWSILKALGMFVSGLAAFSVDAIN